MMNPDSLEDICAAEAEAALAFGRLAGALGSVTASAGRIFAARLLRETLMAALRQEGHAFNERRFFAWFAGLLPLADAAYPPHAGLRSSRAIVATILAALSRGGWSPLATLATRMVGAFLAVFDGETGAAHSDVHALLAEAQTLLATLEHRYPSLLSHSLSELHHAVAGSTIFAPNERASTHLMVEDFPVSVEHPPLPSPRWAIEVQYGEHWRATGLLDKPLPLVGLIRLDGLVDDEDGNSRILRANALRDLARQLFRHIEKSRSLAGQLRMMMAGWRSTSRIPMMFELLTGFGAMRTSQLETLLGATRLGVRKMLTTLDRGGILERSTIAGVQLFDLAMTPSPQDTSVETLPSFAFSTDTIAEYNTSMASVDALLACLGIKIDDDNA